MTSIPEHFKIRCEPVADPQAVVLHGNARFSLLSERMIRMEYCPAGAFEAYRIGKDIEEKHWDMEVRLGPVTRIHYKGENNWTQ
jgi:hypothetical protein